MSSKPKGSKRRVLKNETEVNQSINALAEAKRQAEEIILKVEGQRQRLAAYLATTLAPLQAEIAEHSSLLFSYFESHRDELTNQGRRQSCEFATGILGQRFTPPKTKLTDEEAILAYLVKHRLVEFYEDKRVIRRDALLANRERASTIPGVSFVRDRVIYVKPDEFDVEVELKKKIEPA